MGRYVQTDKWSLPVRIFVFARSDVKREDTQNRVQKITYAQQHRTWHHRIACIPSC